MKKITPLFFLFVALSLNSFAQNIKYKKGIVKLDNKPYCKLTPLDSKDTETDYSIQSIDGTELAYLKYTKQWFGTSYYEMTFIGSGRKVEIKRVDKFPRWMANQLVTSNFLLNNSLNPVAEERFITIFNEKYSEKKQKKRTNNLSSLDNNDYIEAAKNAATEATDFIVGLFTNEPEHAYDRENKNFDIGYGLVERDFSKEVDVYESSIRQDNKEIGFFESTVYIKNAKEQTILSVYTLDRTFIAEAVLIKGEDLVKLITLKDNVLHKIKLDSGAKIEEEVADFLVLNNYL